MEEATEVEGDGFLAESTFALERLVGRRTRAAELLFVGEPGRRRPSVDFADVGVEWGRQLCLDRGSRARRARLRRFW